MSQVQNRVLLHFVWATYDRMPWVTAGIAASVYRYITTVAIDDKCEVLTIGGMPDHVHLLVRMSTTVSIELAKLPTDFAINHNHYIHGAPKVQE